MTDTLEADGVGLGGGRKGGAAFFVAPLAEGDNGGDTDDFVGVVEILADGGDVLLHIKVMDTADGKVTGAGSVFIKEPLDGGFLADRVAHTDKGKQGFAPDGQVTVTN